MTTTYSTTEEARQVAEKLLSHFLSKGYSITALHQYTNEEGNPLFWRVRLDHPEKGKEIRPIALIDVEWKIKEPKFPNGTPLYNLHEIHKRPDETVWIVEGEKCADALMTLGILSTTSGGSTSVEKANWSSIYNRHIIIWPDNDNSGIEYARDILSILVNKVVTSEVVNVNQLKLPEKGDCVDWLMANDNKLPDGDLYPLLDPKAFESLYGDESDKSINAIIALAVGLMSLQFGFVSVFFADILPKLGVALAGILVVLILIGLFGNPKDKAFMNALMWGSFGVAILVVLMSLDIFESGRTGDYFLRFIPVDWIPWIALIVLIVIIVVSSTSKSETTPGGHLLKALGGETIK